VAHALHREGALVILANRTYERAQRLAEEIGCRSVDWAARHSATCELLVNCTSVGMQPNVDESPVHHSFLKPGLVVMDVVYTPETTLLIREAQNRGCHVVTGVDMFVRQAAAQFRRFTGREASLEYMRTVLRRALSPVSLKGPEELGK
jgi:3-dehydroquinate dehydratase/shikimate dehydrogenase